MPIVNHALSLPPHHCATIIHICVNLYIFAFLMYICLSLSFCLFLSVAAAAQAAVIMEIASQMNRSVIKSTHGGAPCQNIISRPLSPPDLSIVRSRAAVRALLIALVIVSESRLSHNSLKGFFPTHSLSL